MKRLFFALTLLFSGSVPCLAQFYPTKYRPPNLNWKQLTTPHFQVVFPDGEDSSAWRMGRILESQYREAKNLTGGALDHFPVVLNNYNDRSNGFVTPFHFRSEIELPPLKGKSLNPQSGSWLETVAPHELVHAMQFSNLGEYGMGQIVSLFSPDLARALHSAIPLGVLEGLAVHYESEYVRPGGGRSNYPFFYNQFNAVFNSSRRWSMGQMVQTSSSTRPFNRHYIGGSTFTSWLQQRYGPETSREAIDFYINFPFLGYGVALRHATGSWPGQLYDQFEEDKQQELQDRRKSSFTSIEPLPIPLEGAEVRRPKWLSDSSLVFYGSFYNARPGFYRYDLATRKLTRLVSTNTIGDYAYDLSGDRSSLVYAYYESSPIYDNTYKAELVELDLTDTSTRRLSDGGRLYAPVFAGNAFLSLQTYHASSRLVRFDPEAKDPVQPVASIDGYQFIKVSKHPLDPDLLAVVAKKEGVQALWITTVANIEEALKNTPDIVFERGSVFDPVWHPEGNRILFSSDISGTLNVYEYDLERDEISQVTRSQYNAFEASYSPDGNRIAFIIQKENYHLPAVLHRGSFYGKRLPGSLWKSPQMAQAPEQPALGEQIDTSGPQWEVSSHSSGFDWLKPRMVFPVFEEISNRDVYKLGLSFHSSDLLLQQSYSAYFSYAQHRLWYKLIYKNTSFFPGFEVSVNSEPSFTTLLLDVGADTLFQSMLRQERNISLAVPLNYIFDRNVFLSSFYIRPEIRQSQIRYFEPDHNGSPASDFAHVTIGNIFTSFNYRLQQNIRDVQPNSGLVLFSEIEQYLFPGNLTLRTPNAEFHRSFDYPSALRGGLFTYVSPLRRWNQSLRLGIRAVTQSDFIFDNQFLVSNGFSEPVFPLSRNLAGFGARYTIPLLFPDNGGFLLPLYLSSIYLVAFTNTVGRLAEPDFFANSRSVYGAGIRARFRISNLSFDIGVGIGFEPTRNETNIFIGNF